MPAHIVYLRRVFYSFPIFSIKKVPGNFDAFPGTLTVQLNFAEKKRIRTLPFQAAMSYPLLSFITESYSTIFKHFIQNRNLLPDKQP